VGCTVAQQPGGTSHGARSAQAREGAGGKVPRSDGGSAGPSGTGGAAGRPECEAQASGAQSSDPAGGRARKVRSMPKTAPRETRQRSIAR
jgi:hypothetical protein